MVAQAQPIFTLARDGARDAVVNVHEWALNNATTDKDLAISLVSDPAVKTVGDVREIAPAFNPESETVRVKVGLRQTPDAMSLGALVNGTAPMTTQKVVLLPWGALFEIAGKPAVWVIDRAQHDGVAEAHRAQPLHQGPHRRGRRPAGRARSSSARACSSCGRARRSRSREARDEGPRSCHPGAARPARRLPGGLEYPR